MNVSIKKRNAVNEEMKVVGFRQIFLLLPSFAHFSPQPVASRAASVTIIRAYPTVSAFPPDLKRPASHDPTSRRRRRRPPTQRRLQEHDRANRQGHRRPERGHRAAAHGHVQPRPLPARRRARAGQDAAGQHRIADPAPLVQAHPVHARPDAGRHHRHRHPPGRSRNRPTQVYASCRGRSSPT